MFLWNIAVTSLAEVWIEIDEIEYSGEGEVVTSLAEVWIEMSPAWSIKNKSEVTSLAEVWIEIVSNRGSQYRRIGHFPCGSVD